MIVSIDPGTRFLSYAVWENERLVYASYSRSEVKKLEDRARIMVDTMASKIRVYSDEWLAVVEFPVVYPKTKIDPNDIVALSYVAGLASKIGTSVRLVKPSEWKGQMKKDVTKRRMDRELDDREAFILSDGVSKLAKGLRHNVYDAVGIGLNHFDRA